jgi:hypothetical protein
MIYKNDFLEAMNITYAQRMARSEAERQRLHYEIACFYYNDYEEISRILKEETLNNPYSADTLKTIRFRHIDMMRKVVKKLTAGVYHQRPIRKLVISEATETTEEVTEELLEEVLEQANFHAAVKDAYEAAQVFNTVFAMPVFDEQKKTMRIDVILPNDVSVHEREADYLDFDAIGIKKCIGGEVIQSVWTEDEHYRKDGDTTEAVPGNESMKNPFAPVIPVSVLRLRKGWDFYGEPNWNLYNAQKELTINNTEMKLAEQKIMHQAYVAVNMALSEKDVIKPGVILQRNGVREDEAQPTLESVTSNYDFAGIREQTDYLLSQLAISEGMNASSVSQQVDDLSGIAKIVDNAELEEKRLDNLELLYQFEIDLLNKIRMVWNKYSSTKLNEAGEFEVEFVEDSQTETVADKTARREMEKKYGIANEIDFVIEDKELGSREEALAHIKQRQAELTELNTAPTIANNETVEAQPEEETQQETEQ